MPFPGTDWLKRIASASTLFEWEGRTYSSVYSALLHDQPQEHGCRNLNAYLNSILISPATAARFVRVTGSIEWTHYLLCYIRNLISGVVVYYGTAAIFHYFCYIHPQSQETFEKAHRTRPTAAIMWDQIKMAQTSMFVYVTLPVIDEFVIEQGWTQAYDTIEEIGGWQPYLGYTLLYLALVEFGVYWMHRTLHTNKWLYKHVHLPHHKYNKPETLSPWASIAFHPLDGMLQASPYLVALFFIPCHYLSHLMMLFFTAIWATYIHDAMDWNVDPVMGSKYHTVHHTHYIYNYGQFFTFFDRYYGTLRVPTGLTGQSKVKAQ